MADIVELIYADHDWFRRQFFLLDECTSEDELTAVWEPLATRLDTHAQAEETIFYPALLKHGEQGDPEEETEDAISDHNAIRDAIRAAEAHPVGTDEWFAAVTKTREENGEHLEEEEREGLTTFIKSATPAMRHDLAMKWVQFFAAHPMGRGIDTSERDPDTYIEENS